MLTSATCAEYEYAGDGPTPPPLCLPPRASTGGAYDPVPVSAPWKSIAETTASSKLMCSLGPSSFRVCKTEPRKIWPSTCPLAAPLSRLSHAVRQISDDVVSRFHTLSLRMMTSSGVQFMRQAAALTMFFFTSSAARKAAFPDIKVTRLEYEPRSMGVTSVSAAMIFTRERSQPST